MTCLDRHSREAEVQLQQVRFSQGRGDRLAPGFGLITRSNDPLTFVQEAEWAHGIVLDSTKDSLHQDSISGLPSFL